VACKFAESAEPSKASTYLSVVAEHHRRRSLLRLQGELDATNRDQLRRVISEVLERGPTMLVVDLARLDFTDCAGLSVLVWAHGCLAQRGDELIIIGAKPIVRRLLHLTDMDTYLHLGRPSSLYDGPEQTVYA
jgi:anti-sigma B factor antagonist